MTTGPMSAGRVSAGRVSAEAELAESTDAALVSHAHSGSREAVEVLVSRYRGIARARAANYFLVGADREDLVQEAMIGLYEAIRDFDVDNGASFAAFADLCITRQILTAIKAATRLKHTPLNTYVSIDQPSGENDDGPARQSLAIDVEPDPLESVMADDAFARVMAVIDDVLSGLEAKVLRLYADGRSYQEIADLLGRRTKSIDNALQRIKRKLEDRLPG